MIGYRDARGSDAAALHALFQTVFCNTFAHLYPPEDLQTFLSGVAVSDWEAQLNDPAFAVRIGEADGVPVGYVKLGPLKLDVETSVPSLLLDQLYVLPDHHGSGIARELMSWAMDKARRRGAGALYLTVYVDNHRARRFYDRYGFEEVGRYEFMVGNHADEDIIMRKAL